MKVLIIDFMDGKREVLELDPKNNFSCLTHGNECITRARRTKDEEFAYITFPAVNVRSYYVGEGA